jgi:hypothetical protein
MLIFINQKLFKNNTNISFQDILTSNDLGNAYKED